MTNYAVTNGDVLAARNACVGAHTDSALVSVKLARVKQRLAQEAAPIIEAFTEISNRHAVLDAAGQPTPDLNDQGEPKVFSLTGTPAVIIRDEQAHLADVQALLAGPVTVSIPALTEADLARITLAPTLSPAFGDALLAFVTLADERTH